MDIPLRKGDDDILFLEEAIDFETNMGFDDEHVVNLGPYAQGKDKGAVTKISKEDIRLGILENMRRFGGDFPILNAPNTTATDVALTPNMLKAMTSPNPHKR